MGNESSFGIPGRELFSAAMNAGKPAAETQLEIPKIELPAGGGAIRSIDEKFTVNAVNGTAAFSFPLPFSPARDFTPSLNLQYNSGSGNGIFGLGWSLSLPSIKRRTDKLLPTYDDANESDTFLLSEAEDLVPEFQKDANGKFIPDANGNYPIRETNSPDGLYRIRFYRPRIEGLFSRIERWTHKASREIQWRVIAKNNVTTQYGWTAAARLADPADPLKIFEWFPELSFDDKGNCVRYLYKKDDEAGFDARLAHNRNRIKNGKITYAGLYLSKMIYGNKTPYKKFGDAWPAENDFLFQTIFDYGEYDTNPPYTETNPWEFRKDAFSEYKSGFDIRTTRLCKRILLMHFFKELPGNSALIRSLDFTYDTASENGFTFLQGITSVGYIKKADGTYTNKTLPPVEFGYQRHEWNKQVKYISPDDLVNAPAGLDEPLYQFTDLFNEGLSGILTEQAGGWYYKHNLGGGKFERAELVSPKPSFSGLGGQLQLADLDGDGGKQLVSYDPEPKGYFELSDAGEWQSFRTFESMPNTGIGGPNKRLLDLDGDGRQDILVTEDNVFSWYASSGRKGFNAAKKLAQSFDEEQSPCVVFSDALQTIFLADMNGDGLTDIVRIRNGEVSYWPNMGYGVFGDRISMDNAPVFDHPELFNPSSLKLADIDGSGTTDIIYLGNNKITCWSNLSGNGFSANPFEIDAFPAISNKSAVTVVDLLGNGVACIVWSGSLAKDAGAPLQYIDLMNSKKPHVLVSFKNNFGKQVSLEYTPSTKYYIDDKLAGKPWITRLHFPVHCISKSETLDTITGSRFVSSYKYHHGYYDHAEREFRGFGLVEQTDTEDYERWAGSNAGNIVDEALHQPPVHTKTWTHTGAFFGKDELITQFEKEYWYEESTRRGFPAANNEKKLPDATLVPAAGVDVSVMLQLNAQDWREAARACKSMTLRSETFALDAPAAGATAQQIKKQLTPYSVATHNCIIELVQPKGQNRYGVFFARESEGITYNYERNDQDPRILHHLNIKWDEYGNALESASVVYPRVQIDATLPAETQTAQNRQFITYTLSRYTNDAMGPDAYRLRLPAETMVFELYDVPQPNNFCNVKDFDNILSDIRSVERPFHQVNPVAVPGKAIRRLTAHTRIFYYSDDLSGPKTLLSLDPKAIRYELFQLAYTPSLLTDIFGPINQPGSKITDAIMLEGKFSHSFDENNVEDGNWWIRSGRIQYIAGAETDADAADRFYVPISYTEPFGAKTLVKYFSDYYLLIEEIENDLQSKVTALSFNMRSLAPRRIRDANDNISEVLVDELGLVKARAVFGKGNEADELTGLEEFTSAAEKTDENNFFTANSSTQLTAIGKQLLNRASARFVYDLYRYKDSGGTETVAVASVIREEHFQVNNNSPVQIAFEYSNGLGQVVMKKVQSEPGMAKRVTVNADGSYAIANVDTSQQNPVQLRWIGNGRTVLNNKGNTVMQYEPYFSVTHKFENQKELVETGVTPLFYYDPMGRLVRLEFPDGTLSRTDFNPWSQKFFDRNDTVLESPWYDRRINNLIDAELIAAGKDPGKEKEAAQRTFKHANTALARHLDTLGRTVLLVDHNGKDALNNDILYYTKSELDIQGNMLSLTDTRGNVVMRHKFDMPGNKVYELGMDSGERYLLQNIVGNPLRSWDARNHTFIFEYDSLHRPTVKKIMGGDEAQPLNNIYERIIYGEGLANDKANNLRNRAVIIYDTAGKVETRRFDFKDNALSTERRFARKYKDAVSWDLPNPDAKLEAELFTSLFQFDALGRISQQTTPDVSIFIPHYNEAGLLDKVELTQAGNTEWFVKNIDYNEKGQRKLITYGNNVTTQYYYDKDTFRLIRLETKRQNNDPLQDLYYTFDPSGNVTHIEDKNIPVIFFTNQKIAATSSYTYDPLYRLTDATGREHAGQLNFGLEDNWDDLPFLKKYSQNDPMAWRTYTQQYTYDGVGNILQMKHTALNGNWTRDYNYEANTNRLSSTTVGPDTYNYNYHPQHGFITSLPHLQVIKWNFMGQMKASAKQAVVNGTPETTYYVYDGNGQRARKITERQAGAGVLNPAKKEQRIYIGGMESFREYDNTDTLTLQRDTCHVMDDKRRIAMVETRVIGNDNGPQRLVRYQFGNHLGSASIETDNSVNAKVISYEEFHPFGTTSYQAVDKDIKSAFKRYRYAGMERDNETGLEYHQARYYLTWLGRWLSPDPVGLDGGINDYAYVKNNPVMEHDPTGTDGQACGVYDEELQMSYAEPCPNSSSPTDLPPSPNVPRGVRLRPRQRPRPAPESRETPTIQQAAAAPQPEGFLGQAAEYIRTSPTAQFGIGLVQGGLAGAAPGGFLAAPTAEVTGLNERLPASYRAGWGLGEAAWGIAQMIVGGAGEVGGVALDVTVVGAPAGVALNVGSAAVMVEAAADISVGGSLFMSALDELPEGTHSVVDHPDQPVATGSSTHPEILAEKLEQAGMPRPSPIHEPHHIVPSGAPGAERAQAILEEAGIHIDEAANGVWLPRTSRVAQAESGIVNEAITSHDTIHTARYFEELTRRLEIGAQSDRVYETLEAIRMEIELGLFPH